MKRGTLFVAVVGAIVIASFFSFFRTTTQLAPPRLAHLGQPADYWFARIPITIAGFGGRSYVNAMGQQYGPTNMADVSGVEAFNVMGTNAVGYLLSKLEGTDSLPEKALTSAATKVQMTSLPFRNAETERMQAVTALIDLWVLPPGAQTRLEQLSTNSESKDVAEAAAYILNYRADGIKFLYPGVSP